MPQLPERCLVCRVINEQPSPERGCCARLHSPQSRIAACSLKEERMAQHLLLRVMDILKLSDCLRGIPGVVDVDLIQYNGEYHG